MASRKDSKNKNLQKGEGQRSDGRYYYRWTSPITSKRNCIYATTLSELRQKEAEIQRDILDCIDSEHAKITLNELFEMNMGLKTNLRGSTRANYMRAWKNNVQNSPIGNAKIADIKLVHIKSFYADLIKKGLKKTTVKSIHNLISQCFEMAVESDFVRKNPTRGAMNGIKKDATEKIPLSEKEVEKLIAFCNGSSTYNIYVPFLEICVGACLRVGEACGLTWRDIDLKTKTININHQLIYKNFDDGKGCAFHIEHPKTSAGTRVIPMSDTVYKAFLDVRKNYMILGRRSTMEIDGYKDFVFVSKIGSPFAPNAVNHFLLNIEKAYNKANSQEPLPHISSHILRHTGCTILASRGIDIKALQAILGHSDASVTMNIYNHSSHERTEKELQRVTNLIAL